MTDDLTFTDEEVQRLEALYTSSDAAERRQFVRDALHLQPGEDVIAVGCGPGFETAGLAEAVGTDGGVYGIDTSEAMLNLANERCGGLPQVTHEQGDAVDLHADEDRFNAAVCVQVIEYIEEVDAAVAELARVLKPGGRAAVYATDWDSVVWHSSDRNRMARVLAAWEDHCAWPHVASQLGSHVRDAGLTVESVEPFPILNTRLTEDTFGYYLLELIKDYVADHDQIGPEEAEVWASDLRDIDERSQTFFNQTSYLYRLQASG
jgi:ubiquinone/menaquinone biosynthesis C-methylase UbiE